MSQLAVLTYHKIAPIPRGALYPGVHVPPSLFEAHLKILRRRGFTSAQLKDLPVANLPERKVLLTFDDGYQDFADEAAPRMQQVGYTGVVFLVSHHLGGSNDWDTALGEVPAKLMSVETIKGLANHGFEFGSHTQTHAHLSQLSEEAQREQIFGSKVELEACLGREVEAICYPYGQHNDATVRLSKEAGYRLGFSTRKGLNEASTDPFRIRRIAIRHDTTVPVFLYKLWRAYRLGR